MPGEYLLEIQLALHHILCKLMWSYIYLVWVLNRIGGMILDYIMSSCMWFFIMMLKTDTIVYKRRYIANNSHYKLPS